MKWQKNKLNWTELKYIRESSLAPCAYNSFRVKNLWDWLYGMLSWSIYVKAASHLQLLANLKSLKTLKNNFKVVLRSIISESRLRYSRCNDIAAYYLNYFLPGLLFLLSHQSSYNSHSNKNAWWPRDHTPLACFRALLFVHFLDDFHGTVMRTRLYSQEVAHHGIKVKNGKWLYLVTYFEGGALCEQDGMRFRLLGRPSMVSTHPFPWSSADIRLGHSPTNIGFNVKGWNSSIVFPVVLLRYVCFFVHCQVLRSRLRQVLIDLLQLPFVWPDMADRPTFNELVCSRVNIIVQKNHSIRRRVHHAVVTNKDQVHFVNERFSLELIQEVTHGIFVNFFNRILVGFRQCTIRVSLPIRCVDIECNEAWRVIRLQPADHPVNTAWVILSVVEKVGITVFIRWKWTTRLLSQIGQLFWVYSAAV